MLRVIFISLGILFNAPSLANSLFNPSTGKLYVPYISFGEQVFSAELVFAADSGLFAINKIEARTKNLAPSYGSPDVFSPEGVLSLARIDVDGVFYQADLLFQAADNALRIGNIQAVNENLPERGTLIDNQLKAQYSQAQIQQIISLYALQSGLQIDFTAQNAVALYKLSYQTIDPAAQLTQASALLALPVGLENPLKLVAVQHGTELLDSQALSEHLLDVPSIGLAATGYAVVAADYLGFGDSEGLHPYIHAHSLASSVIDALRAGKTAIQNSGLNLSGQLFLVGYSEGGYATLAAQRQIETQHRDEFNITASAPMAGPYDLSVSMTQRALADTPHPNPYYFPYIALMLQQVYGIYDSLDSLFRPAYAADILDYFDGQHSGSAINAFLPASHLDIFQPQVYAELADADSWIAASLRANDLTDWKPTSATRLYHCINDDQVPFSNSQVAYDRFQALAATPVELIKIDQPALNQGAVHANCSIPVMLMAKDWFDSFL